MNISASLSSAIAELGSPTAAPGATGSDMAGRSGPPPLSASSASSSALMKVADEAVVEDTGGINAWA
jgi:hypothetical protein